MADFNLLVRLLNSQLQSPPTSSAGRLFDAVSALLGIRSVNSYEGQAAMELEFAAMRSPDRTVFDYALTETPEGGWIIDWRPMLRTILQGLQDGQAVEHLAAGFHSTLVDMMATVLRKAQAATVVLSGGCFQNRLLTEWAVDRLKGAGLRVFTHQEIPPNDACIALGQAAVAHARLTKQPPR